MTFGEMGLDAKLLAAIEALGYETPMPVQSKCIPAILEGRDVLGKSQTGTGKTAAFGLPSLQRMLPDSSPRPRLLVIEPTRELALQVHEHLSGLAIETALRGFVVTGGVDRARQENRFRSGSDWVCATPGRLLDHLMRDYVDFGALQFLVLDEADRLMEMGFLPEVRQIIGYLPEKRQTLLFSATLPAEMQDLARAILHEPVRVDIGETTSADQVREEVWRVAEDQKQELLEELLARQSLHGVLIFTRTKRRADRLGERLSHRGLDADVLHSDRPMADRQGVLGRFREGGIRILVATDLAARGLDISEIATVINYDVPRAPEDYIHRVGRTGRAGAQGRALTLVSRPELTCLARIEHLIRKRLAEKRLEDFPYREEKEGSEQAPAIRRNAASFSTRQASKKKRQSPFTKSGKVRRGFEVPDPAAERQKKKKKRFKMKKRLPHQR